MSEDIESDEGRMWEIALVEVRGDREGWDSLPDVNKEIAMIESDSTLSLSHSAILEMQFENYDNGHI